jgi:hypothetical protein
MQALLIAAMLLGAACRKSEGVIVVTLEATPAVANVATLHVTMTIARTTHTHDVAPPSSTVGGPQPTTFAIDAPAGAGTTMTIKVDARDAGGALLASGSQAGVAIAAGKRTDVTITLASAVATWTVVAHARGLGGVMTGPGFVLEGAIGLPGPRTVAAAPGFSVEPISPAR